MRNYAPGREKRRKTFALKELKDTHTHNDRYWWIMPWLNQSWRKEWWEWNTSCIVKDVSKKSLCFFFRARAPCRENGICLPSFGNRRGQCDVCARSREWCRQNLRCRKCQGEGGRDYAKQLKAENRFYHPNPSIRLDLKVHTDGILEYVIFCSGFFTFPIGFLTLAYVYLCICNAWFLIDGFY